MDTTLEHAQDFVNKFNTEYEAKHLAFEQQFWGVKMALSSTTTLAYTPELLSQTKKEMEDLLSSSEALSMAKRLRTDIVSSEREPPEDLVKTLDIIIKTCGCYSMPPAIKAIREETTKLEGELELARNRSLTLGYNLPENGGFC